MKKMNQVVCILICTVLGLVILYLGNAFLGNPLSWSLSRVNTGRYLKENCPDSDYRIEKIGYNLKTGGYFAHIYSPYSQDSHFTIHFDGWGRYKYDTYRNITERYTTFARLNGEYRTLVNAALPDCNIAYGELHQAGLMEVHSCTQVDGSLCHYTLEKEYDLDISTLELDGEYDIRTLGTKHGHIVLYAEDPVLSVERAADLLQDVARQLDDRNVPFHAIDFHLCEPRNANGQYTGNEITIFDFLYEDIHKDRFLELVQEHWETAAEHYAIQDGIRKYPSEDFLKKIKIIENNT